MRASHLGAAALVAAAAVTTASCNEKHPWPGREIVTFSFTTRPRPAGVDACRDAGYREIPSSDIPFSFSAVFSGEDDGTITNLTLGDFVRDASFDGKIISSFQSAPRVFDLCGDAGADEQLYVVPISLTQSQALRGACPENSTDPGAVPLDPDAGVFPPGWINGHFEAVRGCGKLVDTIHEAGDKQCPRCTMTFDIAGIRL